MDALQKHIESFLVDAAGAAKLLGIGKSLFYEMAASGRLGPMPIEFNSKKLYSVKELDKWVLHKCPPREQWLQILEDQDNAGN